jgi:hypothetical protein
MQIKMGSIPTRDKLLGVLPFLLNMQIKVAREVSKSDSVALSIDN